MKSLLHCKTFVSLINFLRGYVLGIDKLESINSLKISDLVHSYSTAFVQHLPLTKTQGDMA
jgi:hypothetical protein